MAAKEDKVIQFHTTIKDIRKHTRLVKAWKDVPGDPHSATHEIFEDLGWGILLEGLTSWIIVGKDEMSPEFKPGQPVMITLEVYDGDRRPRKAGHQISGPTPPVSHVADPGTTDGC